MMIYNEYIYAKRIVVSHKKISLNFEIDSYFEHVTSHVGSLLITVPKLKNKMVEA